MKQSQGRITLECGTPKRCKRRRGLGGLADPSSRAGRGGWTPGTLPLHLAQITAAIGSSSRWSTQEERSNPRWHVVRSAEHTSELQSLTNLVCRLLLEKKNRDEFGKKQSDS